MLDGWWWFLSFSLERRYQMRGPWGLLLLLLLLLVIMVLLGPDSPLLAPVQAFSLSTTYPHPHPHHHHPSRRITTSTRRGGPALGSTPQENKEADFADFEEFVINSSSSSSSSSFYSSSSSSSTTVAATQAAPSRATRTSVNNNNNNNNNNQASSSTATTTRSKNVNPSSFTSSTTPFSSSSSSLLDPSSSSSSSSWLVKWEEFLDISTPLARKQILLSDLLLNSQQDIRESVWQALQQGKIDPLLTPTGKKLQEGTRAVARQVTYDILPNLARSRPPLNPTAKSSSTPPNPKAQDSAQAGSTADSSSFSSSSSSSSSSPWPPLPPLPGLDLLPPPPSLELSQDWTKVGGRILNALQNQVQRQLETLQQDLADPTRIPQRLSEQTTELVKEAGNIFSETPAGLQEPPYTVVTRTEAYEIRDYAEYTVASTNMAPAGEVYSMDSVGQQGAAFNSLAAYLFGANRQSQAMDMTTPVTTTMSGEMRFYLAPLPRSSFFPDPLEQDESRNAYATGNISIQVIPAARLAVRRFTGFVTSGEVARQKEALLTALALDGVELDVPHGQAVGHVIFQYNPPYTLPVLRRNEIAVPVLGDPPIDPSPAL